MIVYQIPCKQNGEDPRGCILTRQQGCIVTRQVAGDVEVNVCVYHCTESQTENDPDHGRPPCMVTVINPIKSPVVYDAAADYQGDLTK